MTSPVHIKKDCDLVKLLTKNEGVSVVMFTADWCNPCKIIKKKIEEELYKEANFYYVNIDNCEKLASSYKVKGIPMFKFFIKDEKELLEGFSGSDSSKLKNMIYELREKIESKKNHKSKKDKFDSSDFP